jgi:CRP-like cAMP-binding protein
MKDELYLFQNYERMNLADALVPRVYTDRETIIKQGDAADGMYFIEDGTVRVVKVDGNGMEKEVREVMIVVYTCIIYMYIKYNKQCNMVAFLQEIRVGVLRGSGTSLRCLQNEKTFLI